MHHSLVFLLGTQQPKAKHIGASLLVPKTEMIHHQQIRKL